MSSPIVCTACHGQGEVPAPCTRCITNRCDHGPGSVTCWHCLGSGFEPCADCDNADAVYVHPERGSLCSACAAVAIAA